MDLVENFRILRILLKMGGMRNLSARTDTPAALIELHFERGAVAHDSKFTLQELLDSVTESTTDDQSEPQGSFTDIADIP